MAFRPSIADRAEVEAFLSLMLEAYKQGRADKEVIIGIIAGVITSAALDNQVAFDTQIRKSEKEYFSEPPNAKRKLLPSAQDNSA